METSGNNNNNNNNNNFNNNKHIIDLTGDDDEIQQSNKRTCINMEVLDLTEIVNATAQNGQNGCILLSHAEFVNTYPAYRFDPKDHAELLHFAAGLEALYYRDINLFKDELKNYMEVFMRVPMKERDRLILSKYRLVGFYTTKMGSLNY